MSQRRVSRLVRPVPMRAGADASHCAPPERSPASLAIALWRLFEAESWEDALALLHPEFVAHWPQSDETFRSPANYVAVNREHPAPGWSVVVGQVVEASDAAALQLTLLHAEGADLGACFYELRGGLIWRATEVWAERGLAPAWRQPWLGAA